MRLIATLFVLALLSLVAGCGGDEDTPATTAPTAETTTTTSVEEQGGEEDEFTIERAKPGESIHEELASDPEYVLELFFTSGDPDLACGRFATERLLSAAYGDEDGCRQAQVPGATPKAIEVQVLEVTGDEARATVIPEGGPNDGIETKVTLVDDGGWRVDSLEADIPAGP